MTNLPRLQQSCWDPIQAAFMPELSRERYQEGSAKGDATDGRCMHEDSIFTCNVQRVSLTMHCPSELPAKSCNRASAHSIEQVQVPDHVPLPKDVNSFRAATSQA